MQGSTRSSSAKPSCARPIPVRNSPSCSAQSPADGPEAKTSSHHGGHGGRGGKARTEKSLRVKTFHWLVIDRSESRQHRSATTHPASIPQFVFPPCPLCP